MPGPTASTAASANTEFSSLSRPGMHRDERPVLGLAEDGAQLAL